ncbi:MAG: CocE/NonD family hydrolase [Gemmatimonadetes bacterium]|nr:CocE/NonD family hydrolase [Gemmatimonadota bacterium]
MKPIRLILAAQLIAGPLGAQQPAPLASCRAPAVAENPEATRTSLYIPAGDGTKLALDVFLPKDRPATAKYPTVLVSTRYWRAGEGQPLTGEGQFWLSRGYAFVYGDVRGTGASYGQWYYPWSPTEVKDIGSMVAWVAKQPWSDGQVVSIGTSYTGNTAQLVAAAGHRAVKAVVPRFIDFDAYADLIYPGGVVNEMLIRDWGKMVHAMDMNNVPGAPAGVRKVDGDSAGSLLAGAVADHQKNPPLYESMDNIVYRDDVVKGFGGATNDMAGTYRYRAQIERHRVPIFGWASWLDAGTSQGVLNRFMNWSNPQLVVVGPWSHGGGHHTSPFFPPATPTDPPSPAQSEQAACFFDQFVRGRPNGMTERAIIYYTLGEDRWKKTATWPVAGTRMQRYYLAPGNTLAGDRPAATASDSYRVDFEVSTGQQNRWYTQLGGSDVVYPERSEQDARMLSYTSAPLGADLEVTGQAVVTLEVTSTARDGNFFVYLEDVSPDGKSTYVTEGMLRALHRKVSAEPPPYRTTYPYHSYQKRDGRPLIPGQFSALTFQLLPTSVLFRAGHRIRIAIAGADKDTFQRLPAEGEVTITVQTGGVRASKIDLPVVPRG